MSAWTPDSVFTLIVRLAILFILFLMIAGMMGFFDED